MCRFWLLGGVMLLGVLVGCESKKDVPNQENVAQETPSETSNSLKSQSNSVKMESLSLPLEWEDGKISAIRQDSTLLVIDYIMSEEAFMSYYSMTDDERNFEKSYFRKLLTLQELELLVKQCKETSANIRLNIYGITSNECFSLDFSSNDL